MKKPLVSIVLVALAALAPLAAGAQDVVDISGPEEIAVWRVEKSIDELGYNPDYGVGLAASVAAMKSGMIGLRAAYYTEGPREVRLDYRLQMPWNLFLEVGARYSANPVAGFYGFGGAAAPYHRELDRRGGVAFYGIRRDVARAFVELRGNIFNVSGRSAGQLRWNAGASFADYNIGGTTHNRYSANADNSLYRLYRKYGVISDAEAAGGRRAEFRGGLTLHAIRLSHSAIYHSAFVEVGVRVSPDLFDRRADYAKLSVRLSHRMEPTSWKTNVELRYRLGYDGTVWSQGGPVPFYVQSELAGFLDNMPTEGLGGRGTLRGVLQNRVVGDGVAWGSVDLTVDVAQLRFLRREWWSVSPSVFVDAGAVVQPFRLDEMRTVWNDIYRPAAERRLVYSGLDEQLHATAGLGVGVASKSDYVFYALWGKPLARQDGPGAVYAGVKWRF